MKKIFNQKKCEQKSAQIINHLPTKTFYFKFFINNPVNLQQKNGLFILYCFYINGLGAVYK